MMNHRTGALVRMLKDPTAFVAAPVAIMLPVLLGMGGLGIDVSMWYASKRGAQSAADAAAHAAALEIVRQSESGAVIQAAIDDAALNGFEAAAGDVVTVNYPPGERSLCRRRHGG